MQQTYDIYSKKILLKPTIHKTPENSIKINNSLPIASRSRLSQEILKIFVNL